MGTPHSLNYWSLTIRLFSVISRTLVGGVLPLSRAVGEFYSQLDQSLNVVNEFSIIRCHATKTYISSFDWLVVFYGKSSLVSYLIPNPVYTYILNRRFPWCNGYRRRKWTWRHEFKPWTRLIAFHIELIPLGKLWIQLFSLQLWVK